MSSGRASYRLNERLAHRVDEPLCTARLEAALPPDGAARCPITWRNHGNSLAGTNDSALFVASKISTAAPAAPPSGTRRMRTRRRPSRRAPPPLRTPIAGRRAPPFAGRARCAPPPTGAPSTRWTSTRRRRSMRLAIPRAPETRRVLDVLAERCLRRAPVGDTKLGETHRAKTA